MNLNGWGTFHDVAAMKPTNLNLFESAFGLDYHFGLILVAFIVSFYTIFGRYLAVSITDFFQGVIMLIAMVMVPIVAMMNLNGWGTFHDVAAMKPTNLNLFESAFGLDYHFGLILVAFIV
ncbi:sodium:solute symporter family transporter, partial [Staphylococcus aureus]|uniref:sodium:solute symporter family transporter n=1 Tax=Staphylococcus aureus TaxID=1280 RepID=UPI003F99694A